MIRSTSLNFTSTRPNNKKRSHIISFVNPAASDNNLKDFALALASLSDNSLDKVQKVVQHDLDDFRITGTSGDDWIVVGDNCTVSSGAGNDTLVFGSDISATVTDFALDDCISLASAVNDATFFNGVLSLGNILISLPNVAQISDFADMVVYNGENQTTLGDLLEPVADYADIDAYLANIFRGEIVQSVNDSDFNAYLDGIFFGGVSQNISDSDFNNYLDGIFAA